MLPLFINQVTAWAIAGIGVPPSPKEEEERKTIAELSGVDEGEIHRLKEAFKRGGLAEASMRVSEESVEIYAAWGAADKCIQRIQEYVAAGVKLPTICPIGGDTELAIRAGRKYVAT